MRSRKAQEGLCLPSQGAGYIVPMEPGRGHPVVACEAHCCVSCPWQYCGLDD